MKVLLPRLAALLFIFGFFGQNCTALAMTAGNNLPAVIETIA
ncbi:MAG: hypothetical protein ACI9UN_002661 [Granulosicoccus sp.]|jgi:hypothetical protein